jgi:phosphoribosylformylglycinamidine synthase
LEEAGNALYLVGTTENDMAGSFLHLISGTSGGTVPRPDLAVAPAHFRKSEHGAITAGLVRSCHDLSEGGLAVAAAEMAFAGDWVLT